MAQHPPPFFEESPTWNLADLIVASVRAGEGPVAFGQMIPLVATIENRGMAASTPARVDFFVDGALAGSTRLPSLASGGSTEPQVMWTAEDPGPHHVFAQLVLDAAHPDAHTRSHRADRRFWVDGEGRDADIELDLVEGTSRDRRGVVFRVRATNIGPVTLPAIDLISWIDGEAVGVVTMPALRPETSADLSITVPHAEPGDHILGLTAEWPDVLFDGQLRAVVGWHVSIVGLVAKSDSTKPGRWSSLGPRVLVKAQPDGSQGRVDHIAVHPQNPDVLYAGAVRGGLWKSTNGGSSWRELTDSLSKQYGVQGFGSPLHSGGIALDPVQPDIVYFGTGSSRYGGGAGIFKSVDGGAIWYQIATESQCTGVSKLAVRRASDGSVIVYAATDNGLLRYVGADPTATSVSPADWTMLRSGQIEEMIVDPADAGVVYIGVIVSAKGPVQGLYRSDDANAIARTVTWHSVSAGLPAMSTVHAIRVDLFAGDPRTVYCSVSQDPNVTPNAPRLSIFRSDNRGQSWALQRTFGPSAPTPVALNNPFIRVHPTNASLLWFGGVNLFKLDLGQPNSQPIQLSTHDDQHAMTFDPSNANRYYVTGDGGVWRCQVVASSADSCEHRNADLRVLELYDLDVAENDPSLIIGGTQDNGTVVYTGHADWNETYQPRGGDGAYSVICPANHNIMLSQYQYLRDTGISTSGPAGPWICDLLKGKGLPNEALYVQDAYVAFHPANPDVVVTVGPQVYATNNARSYTTDNAGARHSSAIWTARGPAGSTVKGTITRVVFQPGTFHWYAGTSAGQIWRTPQGIPGTWSLIDARGFDEASVLGMAFAPTDNNVLYVLYEGGDSYRRVQRLQGLSGGLSGTWMNDNLPVNRQLITICGDGHNADIAYVGTDKGVFQADLSRPTYDCWRTYNDQLPLVEINDLVVPTGRLQPAQSSSTPSPERALFAATFGRGVWMTRTT